MAERNQLAQWWPGWRARTSIGSKRRMVLAAGVATAELACHPRTWAEIEHIAAERDPPVELTATPANGPPGADGLIRIRMSGAELARVMNVMFEAQQVMGYPKLDRAGRAIARRVYLAMASTAERVSSQAGAAMPQIVLDDRVPDGGS